MIEIIFKPKAVNFIDLEGQRFERLLVLGYVGRSPSGHSLWQCLCDCGNEITSPMGNLRNGHTQSCGCLSTERIGNLNKTHGLRKTRVYRSWANMKDRCSNPNSTFFEHYGGRGIKVCERWEKFENFLADMGEPPTDKHTIDRIDNNGNYEPENCQWILMKEQSRNRRSNRRFTINGETKILKDWAKEFHIDYKIVHDRINRYGWDIHKALTTPSRIKNNF